MGSIKEIFSVGSIRDINISRRKFLKLSAVVAGAEFGIDIVSLIEGQEIHYPVHSVAMRGLQDRCWVINATDIHAGSKGIDFVNKEVCLRVAYGVAETLRSRGAKKDRTILAFTGDGVISGGRNCTSIEQFRDCMGALCDGIPAGVRIAVPGNHEVDYTGGDIRHEYERLGCSVLGWEGLGTRIQSDGLPVDIIGTTDYTTKPWKYEQNPRDLIPEDSEKPALLLTHNVSFLGLGSWSELLSNQERDMLVLAGHSHGGQIDRRSLLQILGRWYALNVVIDYKSNMVSGMYQLGERVRVGICNGIGSAIDIRTAERQVGIMELRPAV